MDLRFEILKFEILKFQISDFQISCNLQSLYIRGGELPSTLNASEEQGSTETL
ncbi:MAG: hypothetical protein QOC99_890, partial [Acidobacteriota bacterium]|nr:hypothetical protein [Acidobacteriota bacterium]